MAQRKRARTFGEMLANPRNAKERAAVAEMKAAGERMAMASKQQQALFDRLNDPTRFVPSMPPIRPLAEVIAEAMSRPARNRRLRSQREEDAFDEVENLQRRENLSDHAACLVISGKHGLANAAFYRRFQRARRRRP